MLKTVFLLALFALVSPLSAQTEMPVAPPEAPPAAPPAQAPVSTPTAPEGMVYVPAGEFVRGTNNSDSSDFNQRDNVPLNSNDARPQHSSSTKAFFIDKTEVTNAQYKKFVDETGYAAPPHWKDGKFTDAEANFPVRFVNWYEATAFAKWAGKRLPTEAEWEKAARGTDGRTFPWGNDWRGDVTDGGGPVEVGKFPNGASPYGALDMTGNVLEWTASWFEAYPKAPTKQADFGQKLKVARGGNWYNTQGYGQTWYRSVNRPQSRVMWLGFRCAKDAP